MGRSIDPNEHAGDMDDTYIQPPPNVYFAKFESVEHKLKNDGNGKYCNAKIRILCSDQEEDADEFANTTIWDILALTDKALWKISEASVSAGNQSAWDVDSEAATKRQLEGRVIKIRTKMEEYEGEKRCKIAKYLKVSSEERQRFSAQHKPAGAGSNAGLPDGPTSNGGDKSGGGNKPHSRPTDDIPF